MQLFRRPKNRTVTTRAFIHFCAGCKLLQPNRIILIPPTHKVGDRTTGPTLCPRRFRKLRLLEKEIENKEVAQAYQREVQAMRDEAATKAALQDALLKKHLRQFNEQLQAKRDFEQGMQMLQYGLGMINPPRTTTTCKWSEIMQTMTCR